MNFLAHLHLARPTPVSRLGNLLGDFVRGRPDVRFSPGIWRGIMHHRHLDAFTDAHPAWKRSRERLDPSRRRFAGILVDVFYDHFLSRRWHDLEPEATPLDTFIDQCHRDLREALPLGPPEIEIVLEHMERQAWLISYGRLEGIDEALHRMASRSPRFTIMASALVDLEAHYDGFETDFLAFYPDAMAHSEHLHHQAEAPDPAL